VSAGRVQLPIRTQLVLFNFAVFLAGGAALLAFNLYSVGQVTGERSLTVFSTAPQAAVPAQPAESATGAPATTTESDLATQEARFEVFQREVLEALFMRSAWIFVLVAAVSVLASWWVARRSLGRIGRVTAAARQISDENLHARLALVGPRDEVRELAETFDAMLDRLERSFAEQRRFTANASHELRTPLTLQRTALEIPLAEGRVPPELQPDIQRALAATQRSEDLISSLLALARGESGAIRPVSTDLAEHARTAIAALAAEADEAGVTVDAELGAAATTGDPSLLAQLVANLAANAVRHNAEGGSVMIRTGSDGDTAFAEVCNTGPVIDPAEIPELFEPFRRGTHRRNGSGLGLSVVRTVAQIHSGRVTAEPNEGGGLTVRAEFPS
jgi:signal transduction histidine kinase